MPFSTVFRFPLPVLLRRSVSVVWRSFAAGSRALCGLLTLLVVWVSLAAHAQTTSFAYTSAAQTYTVPTGVTSISVVANGAEGGTSAGGLGGRVTATLTVTPGQVLTITVGGQGGFNGGGGGNVSQGNNGGGATDIRIGGSLLSNRVLVAGGGGGAGGGVAGGAGGNTTAAAGSANVAGGGGGGGTDTAGGAGGAGNNSNGTAGNSGVGGTGGPANSFGRGGGGGGGYFGGGGGGFSGGGGGGGGGGSSYTSPALAANVVHTQGANSGNGSLSITTFSPDYKPLVDLYNATNGPGWTRKTGWLQGTDPCTGNGGNPWFGVSCANGRVNQLNLNNNNLSGSIPTSLSALTNLQQLYLNSNQLSGSIPTSLGALTNLQYLFLQNNQLSGCFPASLSALCGVPSIYFSGNPGLPGGGDFAAFCTSGTGSDANAPQITTQPPASSAVAAGGSVRVVVGVSGTATGYQWYRNGGVVSNQTSATLTLPTVQAGDAGSYSLVASGCSSVTSTVFTLTINAPTPGITAGTATGTSTACAGTASTNTQSFTFSGSNLTATFVATAPTGFEISTSPGSGFGASATLNPSGGQGASGTIYVRSAATALEGAISGTVSLTSAGATTQNVAVSGMVTANPVVTITATPSLTITQGQSATLTASGALSYSWSSNNGQPGASTAAISVSVAGNYSVTGTTGGCSSVTSVVVSITVPCGAVVYVTQTGAGLQDGSSWTNAFSGTALQTAINTAAGCGAQVWVASGLYTPATTLSMKNGVGIYGGFAGSETSRASRVLSYPLSTTLSGGGVRQVFNNNNLDNTALLDGFVLANGKAEFGGAMSNTRSSPTLTNCSFQANSATNSGGAMYNIGSRSFGTSASNPVLTNCSFQANSATNNGGAMYNIGSNGFSSPVLTNCSFQANSATDGGAMYNFGSAGQSNPVLTNCSFQANSATNNGGAMYNIGSAGFSTPMLTNCVVFGNGGNNSFYNLRASASATYSLFDNSTNVDVTGAGNLTTAVSPFVSASSVALTGCSPAINAGDPSNTTATVGATDLAGNNRIVGGRIDMGAVEYQGAPNLPIAITRQPATGSAVCAGGSITTSVSVTGTVTGYQWYKDGVLLSPAQSTSALSLTNVQLSDAGSYSVVVTGACNSVTSTAFSLTVNAATFTVSNPAICQGQRVNLGNFIGNKSPITGDVTYFTTQADAQTGTNALISGLVGPVNNPITYYARYDAAGCFSIQPIMVTLKPALPAPPVLTQDGHAYTGGVSSVTVAQNSESVILAVPGCDGTVAWSGPNNFVSFNSTISVPTSTTGSFTYSASCTSQTACFSGSSQATVMVNVVVPVCGPIVYVMPGGAGSQNGSSWTNAFSGTALQTAINTAAGCGAQVWVASGLYTPATTLSMKNGVGIYGGFAGSETSRTSRVLSYPLSTTLSGGGVRQVFTNSDLDNTALLDGFVLANGKAEFGGAMSNTRSSPTLTNCSFQANSATNSGGAMFNFGLYVGTSSPVLTNCSFQANSANLGGAMYNIGNGGTSSPVLTNCSFQANSATDVGGAMYNIGYTGTSSPVLTNCSFQANSATFGGTMYNTGLSGGQSSPVLANCVVFNNGGNNTFYNSSATVTATYSLFEPASTTLTGMNVSGPGNLTATVSPFASTTSVALTGCSPAINAGLNTANTTPTDLAGNQRIFGGQIDMGAVEYQGNPFSVSITANPSLTITQGQSATLTASGGAGQPANSYSWTTGETTAAISVSVAGTYSVTGATGSCSGTASVVLSVTTGTPACGTVVYVTQSGAGLQNGSSWTNAFSGTALQTAINTAATCGAQVWVAQGTYKPGTNRTDSYAMRAGVAIYGGFVGSETALTQRPAINALTGTPGSILSGEIGAAGTADNTYHIVFNNNSSLTNTAILDGFVITGGNANYLSDGGAGMFNNGSGNSCNPLIRNCTFQNNSASAYGGAMLNQAFGGTSSPTLINCAFLNNSSNYQGGAMANIGSFGISSPTLINCAFINNSSTDDGGALYNLNTTGTVLTNCSFLGNSTGNHGGAMLNDANSGTSSPVLTNCVFFDNGAANTIYNASGPAITANYSVFDVSVTGYSGSNNQTVNASPFASTTSVALATCSPAINAGLNTATGLTGITTDLAGNQRIVGGRVDVGAVEFQGSTTLAITVTPNPSLTITQGQSTTLTASGATSYNWSSGESTSAISVSVAGPYSVMGTIGSCASVTSVTVTVNAPVCGAGLSGPTWTGCVSTDWNTAGNWASGTVPTVTDDVVIPSAPVNQPILSTTATAKSVAVQTGASLSITAAGSLTINSFATLGGFPTAFYNQGTVTNNGTLMLGNTAPVGLIGLHNTGTFTNTGTLQVDRATNQGINNRAAATFTNTGIITIGASITMGTQGIWNQATFTHTGGTITIDRITGDGLLNSGSFVNSATITIGASASVTGNGIQVTGGSFQNNTGGFIQIDRTASHAIASSSTFTNAAIIKIGSLTTVSGRGLELGGTATFTNATGGDISLNRCGGVGMLGSPSFVNSSTLTIGDIAFSGQDNIYLGSGTFTNTVTGEIRADRAFGNGIWNVGGTFRNDGKIFIGSVANTGGTGILNTGTSFSNTVGALIQLDRTGRGLTNTTTFTNAGQIRMGNNMPLRSSGILNGNGSGNVAAVFNNVAGSSLQIDQTAANQDGITNELLTTFTNAGIVSIGTSGTIGGSGITNAGTVSNSACATLTVFDNISNSGGFTNAGLFTVNTAQPHTNTGTLTNNGLIDYPQGNPIPNVVNNDVIAASISSPTPTFSPALQLGGSSSQFNVGTTWYSDPALTQPAGTYNQGTNTFTATSLATGSTTMLYFAATDNTAGCTRTVAISLMVVTPCGAVVYVTPTGAGLQNGSSWTNAFPGTALQTAINTAAGCGAQVWVAAGTYKPTTSTGPDSRTISFSMANGVAMYGGLTGTEPANYNMASRDLTANKTTLSGDIDGVADVVTGSGSTLSITGNEGNSYHVINNNNNGLTSSAILDGFTISGGNASLLGTEANNGGGMYNSLVSPTIRNCMFYANSAVFTGGAMYNTSSTINLTNCRFLNNKADVGGAIQTQARLSGVTVNHTLLNCSFTGNAGTTTAGAINHGFGNSQGQGVFDCTNCTFTNNYAFNGSDLGSAGAFFNEAVGFNARFTNCLFDGNKGLGTQADEGGGALLVYNGTVTVLNSTFVNNGAATKGGAIRIYQGQGTVNVKNSVFRSNTAPIDADISTEAGGIFTIQNSLLQVAACPPNVTCGPGMLYNQDPRFANPGVDNYQLTACSPAINTGDPATNSTTAGTTDLAGNPRFYTGTSAVVDMGAYEFQGDPSQPTGITSQPVAGSMACAGSTVTATVSVSGTGPTSYQWYKGSVAIAGQLTATLSLTNVQPGDAGSYSVVVTGACNSVTSTAFSLTINPAVTATITGTLTVITGGTTTLTAADAAGMGTGFTWSTGQITAGISVTAGVYSVTVTNASGCTGTATTTVVTVNSAPVAVANANQNAILGVQFNYTVNAFTDIDTPNSLTYSASISPANGLTFNPATRIISGLPNRSGTATVTITATDPGGLSASTTFTITVATTQLTVLSRDPENGNLNTNTIRPYLLLQNDGSSGIPYGELTVRYWLTVENPAPLRFDINYAQMGNDKVRFTYVPISPVRQGAGGYIEFSFDPSAGSLGAGSNAVIQDLINKQDYSMFFQGDDYSYVNNANFAPNPRITAYRNGVLIYGVEPLPAGPPTPLGLTLTANPTTLLTTGNTTLTANATGGTGGYQYTFSGPGTIQASGNTATVSNLPAGVQTFTVVVSDATSPTSQTASATVSVTVTQPVNQPPVPGTNSNQVATQGVLFIYTANAFSDETPASLTYSASFNPANNLTFNPATRVIQGIPGNTGVTSVTITATDPGGLKASTTFTITVNPAPPAPTALTLTASASPTTILTTGSTQLQASVSGGTPGAPDRGYTYTFSGPGTITASGSTATVSNLPPGVQTFTVTVTDATTPVNQTSTTTVSVTVNTPPNQPPVASPNTNQTATQGVQFSYTANAFSDEMPGSLTYTASINPANGFTFNPATQMIQGSPQNTGVSSVTITATDPGGLSTSTVFTITVLAQPVVTPSTLTVYSRDPDNGQLSTNTLKPYLQLQNDGGSPIPYGELTVRYWLTVENPVPLRYEINYAQLGSDRVHLNYVPISPLRQGATGYIEFSFDPSAGSLGANSNSGPIQDLINKQDYSYFNQGDDYSYRNTGNFTANPRITAYRNGTLIYGTEPPVGARLGVEGTDVPLTVQVLGNPVHGSELRVDVRGAAGELLRLRVTDLAGHLVSEQAVERAGVVEQQRLPIGHAPAGLLFLQVSTPTQSQTVKVLKAN